MSSGVNQDLETHQWTAHEILDTLVQHRAQLRELSVSRIGLFGSFSRGEATAQSDLDFLVMLEQETFRNYADLACMLEDVFGRKVDLVPEQSLKPRLRPYVMKDVIYAEGL